MKTKKIHIRIWLFATILVFACNICIQAENICSGENLLSGKTLETKEVIYCPGWIPSTNYTCSFKNDIFTLHLKDVTYKMWQAQFFLDIVDPIVSLKYGKQYCISFDIETNVPLPQVRIKFFRNGNHNQYLELHTTGIDNGKHTISGIGSSSIIQADQVFFDFGGNRANTEIVITNIAIHDIDATFIETVSKEKVTIFPNPVKDILHIQGLEKNTRIQIVDATGSVKVDQTTNKEINISNLSKGLYFVLIDEQAFKIIKQ